MRIEINISVSPADEDYKGGSFNFERKFWIDSDDDEYELRKITSNIENMTTKLIKDSLEHANEITE